MNRRRFLQLAGAVAAAPCATASAQAYPSRPVRLIVGFPPGGGTDSIARLTAQALSQRLGQQIVVENRPGAGTNIATEAVAKSPPDGYTLLLIGSPQAINATLYEHLGFSLMRDIVPVASVARGTYVLVVHPSFPAASVPELITHAKANPSRINMASAGIGTPPHVAGELFKTMAGIDMLHVPYRGDAPALTDLLGGRVDLYFSSLGGAVEHIRAGRLRALAVTSATRSEALPDTPTVSDFVAGYEASGFWGIGAPRTTPADIVAKLAGDVSASLADPALRTRFSELGASAFPLPSDKFAQFVAAEVDKWGTVVKSARIKAD